LPKIFISYRRQDSEDAAGRLKEKLSDRFGAHNVFFDVDSIPVGVNFRTYLDNAVSQCDVLLAIIGRDWLEAKDEDGERRLDDPADFVRIEIESALRRGITVVPVLVRRAEMPKARELPESLSEIAFQNGATIGGGRDHNHHVARLCDDIERLGKPVMEPPRAPSSAVQVEHVEADHEPPRPENVAPEKSAGHLQTTLLVGVMILVGGALLWFLLSRVSDSSTSMFEAPAESENHTADLTSSQKDAAKRSAVMPSATPAHSVSGGRFQVLDCGAIRDTRTKMDWFVGPDHDMPWSQAKRWTSAHSACYGGWRMPSPDELLALYDSESTAGVGFLSKGKYYPAKIDAVFDAIGGGSWAWTGEAVDKKRARAVNLHMGTAVKMKKTGTPYTVRAFATRHIEAHERELASQQDHSLEPVWCKKDQRNFSANAKLICSTPSLWGLEARNVALYFDHKGALKRAGYTTALEANKKRLKAWLKERKACEDDLQCTAETYRRRIAELEALSRKGGY
jgi:hypothetical protein